jgi:hypothetical protein
MCVPPFRRQARHFLLLRKTLQTVSGSAVQQFVVILFYFLQALKVIRIEYSCKKSPQKEV